MPTLPIIKEEFDRDSGVVHGIINYFRRRLDMPPDTTLEEIIESFAGGEQIRGIPGRR